MPVLTDAQVAALRERLHARRDELVAELARLLAAISSRAECSLTDAGDAASFLESRHRATALYAHHERTLAEVDAALEPLRRGRYGTDEASGERVPYPKLEAVPWRRTA